MTIRWPPVVLGSAALLSVLVFAGIHTPLRLPLAFWFLVMCTGMAFVPLFSIRPQPIELAAGVALSIALDTVVTTGILVVGGLSATSGLVALDVLCAAGCAAQLVRDRR
jgi:hypothetical protein